MSHPISLPDQKEASAEERSHSPLGASSASRWMACPGSVALIQLIGRDDSPAPEYQKEGTAAHTVAELCLKANTDTWEFIGETVSDVKVSTDLLASVQIYLDHVRPLMVPHAQVLIEHRITSPEHHMLFGTVDFASVTDSLLNIRDYKNGAGIVVEAENNKQLMYYAYGVLQQFPDVRRVVIGIVQPNATHADGPIRKWPTTADHINQWAQETLIPAMRRVETDHTLEAGSWCRFCPAKIICPMMKSLFGAAALSKPGDIPVMPSEVLGQSYALIPAVKMYLKALEEETFNRNNRGEAVPGTKLVRQRANRVWKDDAEERIWRIYGDQIYKPRAMITPPELEKFPGGKEIVKERAYTPQSGLTVALADDPRPAVKVQTSAEAFGAAVQALSSEF